MATTLTDIIDRALEALEESQRTNSDPAHVQKFTDLRLVLQSARVAAERGEVPACGELVRWVADWIPDTDDPLLARVDAVDRAVSKASARRPS